VKAVIAASFERIHRSNLVGMGVLPLQFLEGTSAQSLGLDGSGKFSDHGIVRLDQTRTTGSRWRSKARTERKRALPVKLRIDTPIEIDYYRHGGICRLCCGNCWRSNSPNL
jgi:aconitate hydratase